MYAQVTLAALQDTLLSRWGSVAFWTPEEGRLAINEGLRLFSLYTGFWKVRVTLPTVANQVYYPLPATLTQSMRVLFNEHPLAYSSVDDQDAGRPGWEADRTTSGGTVPRRPVTWIPVGLSEIAIWPADAQGQQGLALDGLRRTPILSRLIDVVDLGQEDHAALVGYALHTLLFKGHRGRWRASLPLYVQFLRACVAHNPQLLQVEAIRARLGLEEPGVLRRTPQAPQVGAIV